MHREHQLPTDLKKHTTVNNVAETVNEVQSRRLTPDCSKHCVKVWIRS